MLILTLPLLCQLVSAQVPAQPAHASTTLALALDPRGHTPTASEERADSLPTGQLAPYVHISSTDVADPAAFWFTDRQNLLNEPIEDRWDPLKLINTDRPDFTDVAPVVGDGVVQVESGFLQLRKWNSSEIRTTETIPNTLLRVGYGHDFEWRMKWRGGVTN